MLGSAGSAGSAAAGHVVASARPTEKNGIASVKMRFVRSLMETNLGEDHFLNLDLDRKLRKTGHKAVHVLDERMVRRLQHLISLGIIR